MSTPACSRKWEKIPASLQKLEKRRHLVEIRLGTVEVVRCSKLHWSVKEGFHEEKNRKVWKNIEKKSFAFEKTYVKNVRIWTIILKQLFFMNIFLYPCRCIMQCDALRWLKSSWMKLMPSRSTQLKVMNGMKFILWPLVHLFKNDHHISCKKLCMYIERQMCKFTVA